MPLLLKINRPLTKTQSHEGSKDSGEQLPEYYLNAMQGLTINSHGGAAICKAGPALKTFAPLRLERSGREACGNTIKYVVQLH